MIRESLFERALLGQLKEQGRNDKQARLRTDPDSHFLVKPTELRALLGATRPVFNRLPLGELPTDPSTHNYVVTGAEFTALEATLCQIRAEKRRGRP